ncbi:ROK family protein [Paenibacillus sp. OV219]|uniref:ROK family protein n=1 Tax=Paenibacillus sp. OV219 TaxID=1884377 RepID=UPI0008B44A79|nr:ROK family protein [Paenibacillus sp. OV219]SEN87396.1 glucokinase [Paenibacillus sp. OV219]
MSELQPSFKQAYVGVDIGGTNTVIGIFDRSRRLLGKRSVPTLLPHLPGRTDHPAGFFDLLQEEIERLVLEVDCKDGLALCGMGVPGRVDPVRGRAEAASNKGWFNVPFAEQMSDRLGVPVHIDNDVRIYGLGEVLAGAGRGYRNVLCLTVGTGIAAATFVDGRIVRGGDYFAGEIGHDPVAGESALCACGERGCVESIVSATGISRLAAEAVASLGEGGTKLSLLGRRPSALDVYQAASAGDAAAREIFRHVGEVLASKLLTAVCLLNPDAVIVGGGVAEAGELLLGPVREKINSRYVNSKKPVVLRAALGDSAGLIGAVAYASQCEKEVDWGDDDASYNETAVSRSLFGSI